MNLKPSVLNRLLRGRVSDSELTALQEAVAEDLSPLPPALLRYSLWVTAVELAGVEKVEDYATFSHNATAHRGGGWLWRKRGGDTSSFLLRWQSILAQLQERAVTACPGEEWDDFLTCTATLPPELGPLLWGLYATGEGRFLLPRGEAFFPEVLRYNTSFRLHQRASSSLDVCYNILSSRSNTLIHTQGFPPPGSGGLGYSLYSPSFMPQGRSTSLKKVEAWWTRERVIAALLLQEALIMEEGLPKALVEEMCAWETQPTYHLWWRFLEEAEVVESLASHYPTSWWLPLALEVGEVPKL